MDNLFRMVSSWLADQRAYARQLRQLASEVDSTHKNCNNGKVAGATFGLGSGLCGVAAGVATLFTGGLAAPLAVLAGVYGAVGAATTITSDVIDKKMTTEYLEEAKRLAQKSENTEKAIKRELQELIKQGGGSCCSDPDTAVKCILRAIAENKPLTDYELDKWKDAMKSLVKEIYTVFCTNLNGTQITPLSRLATLGVGVGLIGAGVFTLVISVSSLIDLLKEEKRLNKGEGTDASNSLREAANLIERAAERLQKDIDDAKRR